jgi:DNA polymerase III epsilon subunit-like protein
MTDEQPGDGVNRVMIDIETLGSTTGAAIVSLGAAVFDTGGVKAEFEQSISLDSCLEIGLSIEADTLEWWLDKDETAREVLKGGDNLAKVLAEFMAWYELHDIEQVWANSPSFDCEQLEFAFEAVEIDEIKPPWKYHEERDYRTLKELPLGFEVDIDHKGTKHDALDDAVHQARVAAATLSQLQGAADGA